MSEVYTANYHIYHGKPNRDRVIIQDQEKTFSISKITDSLDKAINHFCTFAQALAYHYDVERTGRTTVVLISLIKDGEELPLKHLPFQLPFERYKFSEGFITKMDIIEKRDFYLQGEEIWEVSMTN